MRFFGTSLNKIEPCNVILFTQSQISGAEKFLDLKPESQNFFKEVFRLDQKLNVINFRKDNAELKKLSERNAGIFYQFSDGFDQQASQTLFSGFYGLKHFIAHLANVIEPVALFDFELKNAISKPADPKSVNLYFQKQNAMVAAGQPPPISSSGYHNAHRTNSEVKEPKHDQKLKWPLPLESQSFVARTGSASSTSTIWLGSSIPKLIIDEPMQIEKELSDDSSGSARWDSTLLADVIAIHDSRFTSFFVSRYLDQTKTQPEIDR